MGSFRRAAILLIAASASGAAQLQQNSQVNSHSDGSEGMVIFASLFQPIYPPVARLANVTGDVELKLSVRRAGSVASASVVSGPPLLQQAALISVQQSVSNAGDAKRS